MIIKDSFTSGPSVTRQRRLTAGQKRMLRGASDEVQPKHGGTLPNNRSFTAFKIIGSRQALEGARLAIKVAYPSTLGSPHPADVLAFITSKFPKMEIEHSVDRKSGLIEMVLKQAVIKKEECAKCGSIHKDGCSCSKKAQMSVLMPPPRGACEVCGQRATKWGFLAEHGNKVLPMCDRCFNDHGVPTPMDGTATPGPDDFNTPRPPKNMRGPARPKHGQMDAGNLPAGTAANPIDGQRDALSTEEVEGTGKIAQMAPPPPPTPGDPGATMPPPAPGMDGPGESPPDDQDPESEMGLDEALEMLQESTQVVVDKVQEGDALIHGQEMESIDEAPPQAAPPAAAPFAAGSPISARKTAQEGPSDPKAPSWLTMQKLMEAKERARKRVEDQKGNNVGLGDQPKADQTNMGTTSDPGTINKQKPGEPKELGFGTPEDQEFFWLDELAETRVNTTWNPGKRNQAPSGVDNPIHMPEGIDNKMRNDVSRPYGYTGEGGDRQFQGIPFLSAQKGRREKDNTLASVLPTNIYNKARDMTPPLRESKWQWQKLTPAERQQAKFDMMFANKAIRDRIRNIMNQTPDGPVKQKTKIKTPSGTEGTRPPTSRTMNEPNIGPGKGGTGLRPVPPVVRKKGEFEETAVDGLAQNYWEQLFGEYGHQMTKDCCPEHKGILDQRQTDMRDIAAELGIEVSDDVVEKVALLLHRPKCVGYFMDFARRGFSAPPMDRMVDMALELSQSDAGLARQLDRLTLKYLMKTSDLMNAMTPDAQRTVLLRAIRGDKRIYNSLLRLYNQSVGVDGPVAPEQAPRAVQAAINITAKGFEVAVHGPCDDAVSGIKDHDKANQKKNKQPIPGHVQFRCEDPRWEGKYVFLDVSWDPSDCKDRAEDSIRQLLISYVKGLASFRQYIDFGFMGTPHLKDVDVEAGFASIFFRTNKGGDAVTVNEQR